MYKSMIKNAYLALGKDYYLARKNKSGISYFYNELLEFPTTLSLLEDVKNKKILDLGCGPGIHAKKLFQKGAQIKGIDISKEFITMARVDAPKIEFKVGDVEKRLPYKNGEFDIVFASLVMGHLDNWDKALNEIKRVLKSRGIFIFSNYNPVTEKFLKKKWFFKSYRELNGYFEEGIKRTNWKAKKEVSSSQIIHYHKTYGTTIRELVKNGFEIIDYKDCKPSEKARKMFPKEYARSLNYPHFCVWKVRKKV